MNTRLTLVVLRLLVALPLLSLDWPVAQADSTPLPAVQELASTAGS